MTGWSRHGNPATKKTKQKRCKQEDKGWWPKIRHSGDMGGKSVIQNQKIQPKGMESQDERRPANTAVNKSGSKDRFQTKLFSMILSYT